MSRTKGEDLASAAGTKEELGRVPCKEQDPSHTGVGPGPAEPDQWTPQAARALLPLVEMTDYRGWERGWNHGEQEA